MNELFISLPNGKTVLPAQLIVHKMGRSVHFEIKTEMKLDAPQVAETPERNIPPKHSLSSSSE